MLLPCPDGSLLCVHDAAAGGWRVDVATFDPDAAEFAWADGFLLGGGADALGPSAGLEPVAAGCLVDAAVGVRVPIVVVRRATTSTTARRWTLRGEGVEKTCDDNPGDKNTQTIKIVWRITI